jgi:hypothetical protein
MTNDDVIYRSRLRLFALAEEMGSGLSDAGRPPLELLPLAAPATTLRPRALARDRTAAAVWERLSYTNKKEIARNLGEAKKPETRQRRLTAAIERLSAT